MPTRKSPRQRLHDELENFQHIAQLLKAPIEEIPELPGFDIGGASQSLSGSIGGDHIVYLDFNQRYDLNRRIQRAREQGLDEVVKELEFTKNRFGILIADVSGHKMTDALVTAMLHQSFLTGVLYELDIFGTVTTRLFENINNRFYKSASVRKFLTMLYCEIDTEGNIFFISSGHPDPIIFSSRTGTMSTIDTELVHRYPPIGTLPSKLAAETFSERPPLGYKEDYRFYKFRDWEPGDIMIICTDGLTEHRFRSKEYYPSHLGKKLQQVHQKSAEEITKEIVADLKTFAPLKDDLSFVLIKRT